MPKTIIRYELPKEASGRRLDQVLAELCQELSRSQLKALIEDGEVKIKGQSVKASYKVRGGESVEVSFPEKPSAPAAQELPLKILYEDQDIVVVNKASGMVVHPAPGVLDGTLVNALLFHVKNLGVIESETGLGIVHRLDRDTSGCLVVAKNEASYLVLQEAFHQRALDKFYLALCHGVPAQESFTLDTAYGRRENDRARYTTRNPVGAERRAVSHVKRLESFAASALVEVKLETGRTHQIRVHLYECGHPLLAEKEYGGVKQEERLPLDALERRASEALGRQALHAWRLAFKHPTTGKQLTFEAPIPEDFQRALALLRRLPTSTNP
jgi:23S rRNA pseudouridine1911/1915/1917 synthase